MNLPVLSETLPPPIVPDISESAARLKKTLLEDIRRSVHVFRVDTGGCNACELEIFASVCPVWDVERLGIKLAATPRHADILLVTGAMTRAMRAPAIRAYEAMPDPKIVLAYGACGCTGGIFHDYYAVWGGADKVFPVDVYIPGCPPTPAGTVYAFSLVLGILSQKLSARHHDEAENERVPLRHPHVSSELRVVIEREARRMSGYLQGRQIADTFLEMLVPEGPVATSYRMGRYLAEKRDPRLTEIMQRLFAIYQTGYEKASVLGDPRVSLQFQQASVQAFNPEHRRDPRITGIMDQLSLPVPAASGDHSP